MKKQTNSGDKVIIYK